MHSMTDGDSREHAFLGDVLVVGLGKSGTAVAQYVLDLLRTQSVNSLTVYAGDKTEHSQKIAQTLTELGARVIFDDREVTGSYDIGVVSPGISPYDDFFKSAQACCKTFVGEAEFAYEQSPELWVGITGTNGKTTTTSLATALINEGKLHARAVGNIGVPCITAVGERSNEILVAELSSFQLETTKEFAPEIAVLLNITPDHLEWHKSHANYVAAKRKIFANLAPEKLAVVVIDDPESEVIAQDLLQKGHRVCVVSVDPHFEQAAEAYEESAYLNHEGQLTVNLDGVTHTLIAFEDMSLKGEHNAINSLCAAAIALELGTDDLAVSRGLLHFAALEHRIEPAGEVSGVAYFNDSKATNTDSVLKALTAFPGQDIVLLLGGHDKGTELEEFAVACTQRCKAIVCYGEAKERFLDALSNTREADATMLASAEHMKDAVLVARSLAERGDVVLLSPACSSYDEFNNYEERGRAFKELVATLDTYDEEL